jgi:hypothetical protein
MESSRARLILGLPDGHPLSSVQIKSAWREAAVRTHPDRGGRPEDFVLACEAYKRLESELLSPSPLQPSPRQPDRRPPLRIGGPFVPAPRATVPVDPSYFHDQALLEAAFGQLGYWGRTGDGLTELWHNMWGKR